jgi:hypothetical protein
MELSEIFASAALPPEDAFSVCKLSDLEFSTPTLAIALDLVPSFVTDFLKHAEIKSCIGCKV